ncbi:hypothetical protein BDA99DRAFT_567552 [Phascolomyces articulosus]|uniref:Uncharacterized protein n=1 Tax=Phascolomyces articulosus TaxID=60185 RepID=A0AAD5PLE3_9FUNG|nr:hypothetical protein BDA99DRAFT_567552 [Phascolomyces articulosus]
MTLSRSDLPDTFSCGGKNQQHMLTRSKSVKDYRVSEGEHVWRSTMRNERNAGHAHTLQTRAKQDERVRRSVPYRSSSIPLIHSGRIIYGLVF